MILAATLKSRGAMLVHTLMPARGHRGPRGAGAARAAVLMAVVLGILAFFMMRELLRLLSQAGGTLNDAASLIAVLANLTLAGLLVFDLHEGVSVLLADTDLDLLRRAPLKPHTQLAIKLFDALPRTSLLMAVMIVPSVLAFHDAFHLAPWSWALLPVQALSLWALPFGLGAAAAVLMLRLVPARHAREALGLVSSLTLLVLWLANSFLLPRLGGDTPAFDDFRGSLARLASGMPRTPGGWLATSLTAAAQGDAVTAVIRTVWLASSALVSLALVVWVANTSLENVQARIVAGSPRRTRTAPRATPTQQAPLSLMLAMTTRDGRLLRRNWTILGDLLTTVVLWTLLPVLFQPLFDTARPLLARTMLLALAVAVGSEVGARALPLERAALMWARLSPVAPARWLAARFAGAATLSAALIAGATAATAWSLGLNLAELLGVLALVVPALVGALGFGMWAGVAYGDPRWTNPRAMLRPAGRIIATLLLIAQAILWISLAARAEATPQLSLWLPLAALLGTASVTVLAFADAARRLALTETQDS